MYIYGGAVVLSLILAYIAINSKTIFRRDIFLKVEVSKIFAVLSFLPLFLVSALRYGIGTDYFYRYVPGFQNIRNGGHGGYELGFYLINKVVAIFTSNFQWVFVLTSLLICGFIFLAIYQQSEYVLISIALFLGTSSYFIAMNAVRQCVAVAIFIFALKYVERKEPLKYFIWMLIAASIHLSAFIYFPVYFVLNRKIKTHIITAILALIAMPVITDVIIYILSFTKYIGYFKSQFNTGTFDMSLFIINISILIFAYCFYKKLKNERKYIIFLNLQFITVLCLLYSAVIPLMSRVILCFTFSQILFVPYLLSKVENKKLRWILMAVIIVLYCLYMTRGIFIKGYQQVSPYQSIF